MFHVRVSELGGSDSQITIFAGCAEAFIVPPNEVCVLGRVFLDLIIKL
jgi:hypothetical protein